VETEQTSIISKQWLGKHTPTATDMHTVIQEMLETVYSVWFMLKLCNKDQWDHLVAMKKMYCRLFTTQFRNAVQYYY
jgi:hypothetical protein